MMAESEETDSTTPVLSSTLPRSAKRCRIPRLNRTPSGRLRNDYLDALKSDGRPKSLIMASTRDYPWHLEARYGDVGSVASVPLSVDDEGSVKSFSSCVSYSSFASQSQGTEVSLSRPISRCYYGKKYVLHCDRHVAKQEEYLTPTQRKDREIRQLKSALQKQNKLCEEKNLEIERLKSDLQTLQDTLQKLQLEKHVCMSTSQESDTTDSLHEKNSVSVISFGSNDSEKSEGPTSTTQINDDSGISHDMSLSASPRDCSEFDELEGHHPSKVSTVEKGVGTDGHFQNSLETPKSPKLDESPKLTQQFEKFLSTYHQQLDLLKIEHREQYQDLKDRFNDRVDDMLKKLSEANMRYLELRPMFQKTQDKIENIESQLGEVQKDMETQEEFHNKMYLRMYRKGQEAGRLEDPCEPPRRSASVPDLLRQLQQLELELEQTRRLYRDAAGDRQAEYTLRFLKDAVFYFLTQRGKEHLKAIQSILGFTDAERMAVAKAMRHRRL